MKRFGMVTMLVMVLLAIGTGVSAAAPRTAYNDFLANLDSLGQVSLPGEEEVVRQLGLQRQPLLGANSGQVVALAQGMLGQRVVWGGASPAQGFDCSGLVQYVFRQAGIALPRTADLQFLEGIPVFPGMLQPGDLVYYTTYEPGASHVGIYIGRGKFIHTSYSKGVVAIADVNDAYFVQRYYGAKRIL